MSSRQIRQFLQTLASSGITHLPQVSLPKAKPKPRIATTKQRPVAAPTLKAAQSTLPTTQQLEQASAPSESAEVQSILSTAFQTTEEKSQGLSQLSEVVSACQRCKILAEGRTQTVFGVGNPDARIMFIGEAPGADEDRQGEPFVGAAGQLMNKIITACGLKREELYICNILRCRPPGNRNPLPQEAANCREFLDGQIKIVNPEYIICWGTVAAQNLLGEQRPVGKLRGQFLQHGDAKVLCTYHPSYLLRNASAKKQVWIDMKFFMKDLGVDLD